MNEREFSKLNQIHKSEQREHLADEERKRISEELAAAERDTSYCETGPRLKLIRLVASVIFEVESFNEKDELRGMIQKLCEHSHLSADTPLSPSRRKILERVAGNGLADWEEGYKAFKGLK